MVSFRGPGHLVYLGWRLCRAPSMTTKCRQVSVAVTRYRVSRMNSGGACCIWVVKLPSKWHVWFMTKGCGLTRHSLLKESSKKFQWNCGTGSRLETGILTKRAIAGAGRESAGRLLWCLYCGVIGDTRSWGIINFFGMWEQRLERPNAFNGASSDDDDYIALCLLRISIMALGRCYRLVFSDGFCPLQFSAWVVMLLLLEHSCSLTGEVGYSANFC